MRISDWSSDVCSSDLAEDDGQSVGTWLRVARRRLALLVAIGDLAGHLDLTQVTGALTGFADHALDLAIRTAIAERTPDAEPVGFAAIALGKQGRHELNYSSAIARKSVVQGNSVSGRVRLGGPRKL